MSNVVIYIDGSHCKEKKSFVNGWAMRVHANGETYEHSGALTINQNEVGTHEFFAFVECMHEVKRRGYDPKEVSIYTDDEVMAYIDFNLHKDNYRRGFLMSIDRWKFLCKNYYTPETVNEVIDFIRTVRVNKVKGHNFCVENLRCDYLAKHAAKSHLYGEEFKKPCLSWDDQLQKGFEYYNKNGELCLWHPHFVKNVSELLGVDEDLLARTVAIEQAVRNMEQGAKPADIYDSPGSFSLN